MERLLRALFRFEPTHTHTRTNTIVVVASGIVRALRTSFTEKWNPRRRRTHNFFGDLRALILTFLRRAHGA